MKPNARLESLSLNLHTHYKALNLWKATLDSLKSYPKHVNQWMCLSPEGKVSYQPLPASGPYSSINLHEHVCGVIIERIAHIEQEICALHREIVMLTIKLPGTETNA